MGIRFSVIIPAYNIQNYLAKCLDSILQQSWDSYEVIVVNDGSTDTTPYIADSYAQADSRIRVIHKANEGVSAARNAGIEQAQGEFFLFFDGDDFVEPACMEELDELARAQQADTVIYGYYRYRDGAVQETCPPVFQHPLYEGDEIVRELIPRFIGVSENGVRGWLQGEPGSLYVENPALWRTMVSGELIRTHGLRFRTDLRVGEDTIFTALYLSYARRCAVSRTCYYYLTLRDSSTIAMYEKNSFAKWEQKTLLLRARTELTEDVLARRQTDLSAAWSGTVLMSCVELAFLLAQKQPGTGVRERYRLFRSYVARAEVRRIIRQFQIRPLLRIYAVPFVLLKLHWNGALYVCAGMMQLAHFKFKRV